MYYTQDLQEFQTFKLQASVKEESSSVREGLRSKDMGRKRPFTKFSKDVVGVLGVVQPCSASQLTTEIHKDGQPRLTESFSYAEETSFSC